MGARVCALLLILSALKVPWMLEQPQSSLFEHLPWFSWLCTRFNVFKATGQQLILGTCCASKESLHACESVSFRSTAGFPLDGCLWGHERSGLKLYQT